MDTITALFESILRFLLQLLELLVNFIIAGLNLFLDFARGVVDLVV